MKFILATLAFAFAAQAHAGIECVATEVNGGPLEESFSVDEYPEVSITAEEANIGSSSFEVADGSDIEFKDDTKTLTAVVDSAGAEQFILVLNKKTHKAKMYYQSGGQKDLMATLTCD